MLFQNREEAAELLAEKLSKYRGQNPLVLGILRGAVPMASEGIRELPVEPPHQGREECSNEDLQDKESERGFGE